MILSLMLRILFSPVLALLLLFSASLSGPAYTRDCLNFMAVNFYTFGSIISSLQETFAKSGVCFTVDHAPAPRNSLLLKQGKTDGELFRIPDYQNTIGDAAIMVPEPIIEGYGLLVTKSESVLDEDLANIQGMAVGRGVVWQNYVSLPEAGVSEVGDYASLMTMLRTGRVSAVLIDNVNFTQLKLPKENLFAKRVTPKLQAHLFLHARHTSLLPEINKAIRVWRAEYSLENGDF